MSITKIKRFKINNLNPSLGLKKKVTLKFINSFYNLYKEEFKDSSITLDPNSSEEQVLLIMMKYLINKDVCDTFQIEDDIDDEISIYEYHSLNHFYKYGKIDLYPIFSLRKEKEIFNLLCFILKQLIEYIPFPTIEQEMDWYEEYYYAYHDVEIKNGIKSLTDYYMCLKDNNLSNILYDHLKSFKEVYTENEIFDIIDKYPKWGDFIINSLIFLENPIGVTQLLPATFDYDSGDVEPVNCYGYWGFSWGDYSSYSRNGTSALDRNISEYFEMIAREGGEVGPMVNVDINKRHLLKKKKDSAKRLFNLLTPRYEHNIYK